MSFKGSLDNQRFRLFLFSNFRWNGLQGSSMLLLTYVSTMCSNMPKIVTIEAFYVIISQREKPISPYKSSWSFKELTIWDFMTIVIEIETISIENIETFRMISLLKVCDKVSFPLMGYPCETFIINFLLIFHNIWFIKNVKKFVFKSWKINIFAFRWFPFFKSYAMFYIWGYLIL